MKQKQYIGLYCQNTKYCNYLLSIAIAWKENSKCIGSHGSKDPPPKHSWVNKTIITTIYMHWDKGGWWNTV